MELDDLKKLWQEDTDLTPGHDQRLRDLLSARSNSPVAKMKRNLKAELWAVIILYGVSIVFYFTAWNGKMIAVGWFMLVLALLFFVYYIKKIRLLDKMSAPGGQLKQTLQQQVKTLESFVRLYFLAGTIIVPISLLFFAWIYYSQSRYISPSNIFYPSDEHPLWRVILVWTILIGFISYVSTYLNRWYVNKLYSRH